MVKGLENPAASPFPDVFMAGAAQVDITPPVGTLINGDFFSQYARYIHDNLYAKAVVLQSPETAMALVVVDICVMGKEFLDAIKEEIHSRTGIAPSHLLISSTHTHAAGAVENLHLGAPDMAYRQALPKLIVAAVEKAQRNLRPAQIAFGAVDAPDHVLCRRYRMQGGFVSRNPVTGAEEQIKTNPFGSEHLIHSPVAPMDPQVGFLAVRGLDGKWISILANYSLHYVGDWENGTITADYFGVFATELQRTLRADGDFVGIMSNGTSGEANTWDFLHPGRYPTGHFEKSQLIGSELAHKVFQALPQVSWQAEPRLAVRYQELPVAVRKPSAAETEAARKLVVESDYANFKTVDEDVLQRLYAREQVLLASYPEEVHVPLQALRIGEGIIGALGGEFFAETGLRLKEGSPARHYFTVTLANGYLGYVPPAHELDRGGYETWRCRTSFLEPEAEEKIRTTLAAMIQTFD